RAIETCLAARAVAQPALPEVGRPAAMACSMADKGFEGQALAQRCRATYDANLVAPPHRTRTRGWPAKLERWWSQHRQIVETVAGRLHRVFRLAEDRPHTMLGLRVGVAAKVALHNFCLALNTAPGRPPLSLADLVLW